MGSPVTVTGAASVVCALLGLFGTKSRINIAMNRQWLLNGGGENSHASECFLNVAREITNLQCCLNNNFVISQSMVRLV
jgi:hypothetical protein